VLCIVVHALKRAMTISNIQQCLKIVKRWRGIFRRSLARHPLPEWQKNVIPTLIPHRYVGNAITPGKIAGSSTPTGSLTESRKAGVSVSSKASRHKTRHKPTGETDDLAELVRVLSGLTPEERAALLTLARGLRSPAK